MKKNIFFATIILFVFFAGAVQAAYPSQCKKGQGPGEPQDECTHENDQKILENQCTPRYGESNCQTMASYLNTMSSECYQKNPPDIDCGMIPQNGIYGREAAKYAAYQEENPGEPKPNPVEPGSDNWNLNELMKFGLPSARISTIIENIALWLLFMIGFIGILGFVISGFFYLTSAGNDNQITRAKNAMLYSIIGTVVAIIGVIVLKFIFNVLSGVPY